MANDEKKHQDSKYINNTITAGDVAAEILTPKGLKDPWSLVKRIIRVKDGGVLFQFVSANYHRRVLVRTYEYSGVLYAITIADKILVDVYPVADMADWKMIGLEGRPVFEGRRIRDTVYQKHLIALREGLTPEWNATEKKMFSILEMEWAETSRKRQEELKREQEALQAQRDAEEEARRKTLSRILARPLIRGFNLEGIPLAGVPVVDNEWQKLRHGAKCVGVVSYDDEGKTSGPITGDHFMVNKKGHVKQERLQKFVLELAKAPGAELIGSELIPMKGDFVEVHVYTRASLDHLKASGLNGGALVGVKDGDFLQLYRFNKKGYQPEGGPIKLADPAVQ